MEDIGVYNVERACIGTDMGSSVVDAEDEIHRGLSAMRYLITLHDGEDGLQAVLEDICVHFEIARDHLKSARHGINQEDANNAG